LKNRLENIRQRIHQTAIECGRNPDTIRVVAVSKTHAAPDIRKAVEAGVTIVGENYIQEARKKIESLPDLSTSWHFIGHLQSNKAKYAVRLFDLIHTVDSFKLAMELDRQAAKIDKIQEVLVQVNTGMEDSKSGVAPEEALPLAKQVCTLPNLRLRGLMTIPPLYNEPDRVAPYFRLLRETRDRIRDAGIEHVEMDELSMGMTGDFEVAIREGATLVRIGTAIFGERM